MALRNLLLMTKEVKLFLPKKSNWQLIRKQPKSNLTPPSGWFGDMFKVETIKEYWEIIPVIVTGVVAGILPFLHIGWMCYKANDIRWWPGKRMLVEKHQYIIDGAKPPCYKYHIINKEKFKWSCGLLTALKDSSLCSDTGDKSKAKKCSYKFWQRNTDAEK